MWPERAAIEVADVRDIGQVRRLAMNVDAVVHLAGHAHDSSASLETLVASFVEGARVVATVAQSTGMPLVIVSSAAVYGSAAAQVDSATQPRPDTAYGTAKLESERVALAIHWRTMILRSSVVFGRYDRGNMSRLIRLVSRIGPVVMGDGLNRKSMMYAPHLGGRIVDLLETGMETGVWCASDRATPTQAELVALIAKAVKYEGRPRHVPATVARGAARLIDALTASAAWSQRVNRLTSSTIIDGQELDRLLGYTEPIDLEEAVEQTVRWTVGAGLNGQ
jgi:nucleoside-diphosphate-sugar epimerase